MGNFLDSVRAMKDKWHGYSEEQRDKFKKFLTEVRDEINSLFASVEGDLKPWAAIFDTRLDNLVMKHGLPETFDRKTGRKCFQVVLKSVTLYADQNCYRLEFYLPQNKNWTFSVNRPAFSAKQKTIDYNGCQVLGYDLKWCFGMNLVNRKNEEIVEKWISNFVGRKLDILATCYCYRNGGQWNLAFVNPSMPLSWVPPKLVESPK